MTMSYRSDALVSGNIIHGEAEMERNEIYTDDDEQNHYVWSF